MAKKKSFKTYLLTGTIILLPLIITVYVLFFLFSMIDNLLIDLFKTFGYQMIPGLGFALTVITVFFTGLIAQNVLGRKIIHYGEKFVLNIPLVKEIYNAIKQVIDAFSVQSKDAFQRVVLVEYPRKGLYALGFVTGVGAGEVQDKTEETVVNVFLPTTPNPTSGFFLMIPKEDLVPLDMTVEEGIKMIISAGVVNPQYPPVPRPKDDEEE